MKVSVDSIMKVSVDSINARERGRIDLTPK